MIQHQQEALKTVADVAAGATVVGALMQWLPPIAAALSIVWLTIRLYEWARWVRGGRKGKEGSDGAA